MTTLDGELRTFDGEMLLITDGGGPVAVAGVMGGLESEVTEADDRRAAGGRQLRLPQRPAHLPPAGADRAKPACGSGGASTRS